MKAAVYNNYGSPEVIRIEIIPKPIINDNQVLIRVKASSVNSGDARLRRADPWLVRILYGLIKPRHKVLGIVFAGIVEEIGSKVSKYQVGQKVYGMNEKYLGGHAEYIAINEDNPMGLIPEKMNYVEAAALPFGATTALHFLEGLELNDKTLLLNGASGAVGVNIVQIATSRGAKVTAVTSSKNEQLLKSLGVQQIIDYNLTSLEKDYTEYDIVIDCVNNIGMDKIEQHVIKNGTVVLVSGMVKELLFKNRIKKAKPIVSTAVVTSEQYLEINSLYSSGKLKPVIQVVLPIESIVIAHRIVDSWRKVGSVVITLD
jgi:NADPH:quinone reductase-like Zn-dependent oxidoreductase